METKARFENDMDQLGGIMGKYNFMLERVDQKINQNCKIYNEKAQTTLKEVQKLTKNIEKDNLLIYNKILEQNNKIKNIDSIEKMSEINEKIEILKHGLDRMETSIQNSTNNIEGNILNYQYRTELMMQQIYSNQIKMRAFYKRIEIFLGIIIILIVALGLLLMI